MTSVSARHIILTLTQPVGSGRPQRESNLGPPFQQSSALPTELPRTLSDLEVYTLFKIYPDSLHHSLNEPIGLSVEWTWCMMPYFPCLREPLKFVTDKLPSVVGDQLIWDAMNSKDGSHVIYTRAACDLCHAFDKRHLAAVVCDEKELLYVQVLFT